MRFIVLDEESAKEILKQACRRAMGHLLKPDADPKAIASALKQQCEMVMQELKVEAMAAG